MLLLHFIHIWYLDWPWSEHAHIIPISRMVDFCKSYSPFHVCLTIRPFIHFVYATSLVRTDVWSNKHEKGYNSCKNQPSVKSVKYAHAQIMANHILCTQLVICLLSHFIHIWYLDWPWSEHAHIIPSSRMVDICKSYSPFHVPLQ
jgi:hypothetical protein